MSQVASIAVDGILITTIAEATVKAQEPIVQGTMVVKQTKVHRHAVRTIVEITTLGGCQT